jgi:competence protein ComEA
LTPDADADRVNLAAVLTDGQKVYVPRLGEAAPAEPSTADDTSSSAPPIDLNVATIAQLETLPGVGPATAQAIVDYRSQHGSFRSVEDLLNVRGIGQAKLDQIRALVRV